MGAAADITKKIEDSQKAILDTVGQYEQETRQREGLVPLKLFATGHQYLLMPKEGAAHAFAKNDDGTPQRGWGKVLLAGIGKGVLKKQNTLQFGVASIDDPDGAGPKPPGFVDYEKLNEDESKWLLGWPDY
jgi:hypothetical protein